MLVTSSQAAKLLKISPRRVRWLLAKGRIEGAYKLGPQWAIPLRDGFPVVREGSRGPLSRWAKLIQKPRQENLTVVKVLQRAIRQNKDQGTTLPVISVKHGGDPAIHVHEIYINGPSRLCYSLEVRKDKGGARVWLETHFGVEVFLKDFATDAKQSLGFALQLPR